MPSKKPNIVIFFAEQWRGDAVGCAGHPVVKTPFLDRMKEQGVYFERCYTTNPICGPSRCSFVTGWYPHTRGHRTQEHLIREDEPNLFQYLKEAGYYTAWFGKNDTLSESVAKKYVDLACSPAGSQARNPYSEEDPHFYTHYRGLWDGPSEQHRDNLIIENACKFLRSNPPEPFCLYLPLQFVHPPYFAEEPYFSMYSRDQAGYMPPANLAGKAGFMSLLHHYTGMDRAGEGHGERLRSLYYGMITRTDELFGRLVTTLEDSRRMDDSALIFLSDHGNYAGDYGIPGKWWTGFEDALLRVPLAIRIPGGKQTSMNQQLVQHFDVFATILDLAGIQPKCGHFARSLLPILQGEEVRGREAVFASSGYNPLCETALDIERATLVNLTEKDDYFQWKTMFVNHPESVGRAMMVRTEKWKYVWRALEPAELYDLESDPYEETNLLHASADDFRQVESEMRDQLFNHLLSTTDVIPPGKDGYNFPKRVEWAF